MCEEATAEALRIWTSVPRAPLGAGGVSDTGAQSDMWGGLAAAGDGAAPATDGALCQSCRGVVDGDECAESRLCGDRWLRTGRLVMDDKEFSPLSDAWLKWLAVDLRQTDDD